MGSVYHKVKYPYFKKNIIFDHESVYENWLKKNNKIYIYITNILTSKKTNEKNKLKKDFTTFADSIFF